MRRPFKGRKEISWTVSVSAAAVRLKGEIPISGAKNAALKLMAASLLTSEPLVLANVPRLADVRAMAELLISFGVTIQVSTSPGFGAGDRMTLQARGSPRPSPPTTWCARCGQVFRCWRRFWPALREAKVSLPGGCAIGARPVELHLAALEQMGAKVELVDGYVIATAPEWSQGPGDRFSVCFGGRHRDRDDGGHVGRSRDPDR